MYMSTVQVAITLEFTPCHDTHVHVTFHAIPIVMEYHSNMNILKTTTVFNFMQTSS